MTQAFRAFIASARFRRAPADDPDPPSDWLLSTGQWDDGGVWDDNAEWKDS
jgi:hypothetical protein